LGLPGGFSGDGRFNGTMQNVVGPTLVATAKKFGLGVEIQSPTGLYMCVCVLLQTWHEHFFVLTSSNLYYTEEQQQDANDAGDDAAAEDDVVSCYILSE